MDDLWEQLQAIKKDLDAVEMELAMNAEGIESIEMSLRLLRVELEENNADFRY
jgi:chromosome segregation ATPase